MSETRPGRGSDQFPLRMPDGMRDRLKREAEQNGRSMNAEIVSRLESTLNSALQSEMDLDDDDTSIPPQVRISIKKIFLRKMMKEYASRITECLSLLDELDAGEKGIREYEKLSGKPYPSSGTK